MMVKTFFVKYPNIYKTQNIDQKYNLNFSYLKI